MPNTEPVTKSKRGFASMDPAKQREIASLGGRAVAGEQRSYARNKKLASASGRKGGHNVPDEKRSFSTNRELASEAGRKGGSATQLNKRLASKPKK